MKTGDLVNSMKITIDGKDWITDDGVWLCNPYTLTLAYNPRHKEKNFGAEKILYLDDKKGFVPKEELENPYMTEYIRL
jgi:hypothetical protein